jgi:hypothetical protein
LLSKFDLYRYCEELLISEVHEVMEGLDVTLSKSFLQRWGCTR